MATRNSQQINEADDNIVSFYNAQCGVSSKSRISKIQKIFFYFSISKNENIFTVVSCLSYRNLKTDKQSTNET